MFETRKEEASVEEIRELKERLERERPVEWEAFPDIGLYMDQLISYMPRQLIHYGEGESLTSAMVNNYIKDGAMPRAEGKRYSRTHLAYLTALCALKQVLSVKDAGLLLAAASEGRPPQKLYEQFREELDRALDVTAGSLDGSAEAEELPGLALALALRSYADRLACQRILELLRERRPSRRRTENNRACPVCVNTGGNLQMNDYVLLTDSSADLTDALVKELGVEVLPLSFTMRNKTYRNWPDNREIDPKDFYRQLREGEMATTSAVNVSDFTETIEPHLKEGRDVLVVAFSSGLSATCHSAQIAAQELSEQYPERKVYVVDSLCASLGQGLLVWSAARMKNEGRGIGAVRDWLEENKLHLCHWFTVDDLHFLKRGGRISSATAVLGTMLSIKPVMHVDDEGHLTKVGTARGRNASLKALVDHMAETAIDPAGQTVFISHGDCEEDANKVAEDVKRRFGVQTVVLNNVGPVIGAHSGPGTVALFFLGRHR